MAVSDYQVESEDRKRKISLGIIIFHSKTKSLHLLTHTGMKQRKTKRYQSSVVSRQVSMCGHASLAVWDLTALSQ